MWHILPEVVVTAEEPEEMADAGVVGGTFYFNSSTREGRQALRDRLQQNPSAARQMVAPRAARRFSPTARKIAFQEIMQAGQRQFMWIAMCLSLKTGADLATVGSLLSGTGTAVGVGGLLLRRGGVSVGQGAIQLVKTSSRVGIYASGAEAGFQLNMGNTGKARNAAFNAIANYGISRPAVLGVRATGMSGTLFRSEATGRFVTNSYGIGTFSVGHGVRAGLTLNE